MTMINQTAYPTTDLVTSTCKWLHESLEALPLTRYPFDIDKQLPDNGIYFFYEDGEIWGHSNVEDVTNNNDNKPRIVRIGTHKDGNFKSRISEHFLLSESKMNITSKISAPHDRSIFRKNIGRALIERSSFFSRFIAEPRIPIPYSLMKAKNYKVCKTGEGFHDMNTRVR